MKTKIIFGAILAGLFIWLVTLPVGSQVPQRAAVFYEGNGAGTATGAKVTITLAGSAPSCFFHNDDASDIVKITFNGGSALLYLKPGETFTTSLDTMVSSFSHQAVANTPSFRWGCFELAQ